MSTQITRGIGVIKPNTDLIPDIKTETDKIQDIKTETDKIQDIKTETDKIQDMYDTINDIHDIADDNKEKIDEIKTKVDAIKPETDKIPDIKEETDKIPDIKTETDKIPDIKTETDKIEGIKTNTDTIQDIKAETDKIDNAATDGLSGTADSLSYRVHEIEKHFHGWERGFGKATAPNGEIHVADRLGSNNGSFQIDAGDNAWGAWVQILGSSDTPADAGMIKYDTNRISFTAAERTTVYYVQIAFGATGADALTAGTYTEFPFSPQSVQGKPDWFTIMTTRQAAGTKAWARCMCPGQNTATLDFLVGMHEYVG